MRYIICIFIILIFCASETFAGTRNLFSQLVNDDGKYFNADTLDKAQALVFWDKNCAPCRQELVDLSKTGIANQIIIVTTEYGQRERQILKPYKSQFKSILIMPQSALVFLNRLGNTSGALPFSIIIRTNQAVCEPYFGIASGANIMNRLEACK